MNVIVEQDRQGLSTTTIATYGLSSCYSILVDGYYDDKPFVYLRHHSKWIEPGTERPVKILCSFLKKIVNCMEQHHHLFSSKKNFLFGMFNNMQLLVGGSRAVDVDPIKDAFSLLIEPNKSTYEKMKSSLNDQGKHLLDQLIDHTTVQTGFTYLSTDEEEQQAITDEDSVIWPPAGWLEYDCQSKKGMMGLRWTSLFGVINLASMKIDQSTRGQTQNGYWEIKAEEIESMAGRINHDDYAIGALGRAFSVIPNNPIYKSSIINRSECPSDPSKEKTNTNLNEPGSLPHHELCAFNCIPQDIIKFKLIRLENDFKNNDIRFSPQYADLIFGKNKKIFGYKNLNIDIYCLSSSLNFYLNITYDEKINSQKYRQFQVDDIIVSINQWLPLTTTTNLDLFLSKLKNENEYLPFGKQLLNYKLKGEEESTPYFIYRINQNLFLNSKFVEWYSRLETFLVFFINSLSTINKEDPNWIIYLLYQQYRNDLRQICYTPIGFITVYLYYAYPDKKRPRISQVLILPPYQRKGHGRRLLTTIYNDLRKDSYVQDITAEDPSDEFVALRDLVSLELCHKYLPDLFSKESIFKTDRLTKEMIDKAHEICKLTKQETRRVYEMYFLRSINQNDEEQMKHFRLTVKQRLFHSLKFDQQHSIQLSNADDRKKYLADQYQRVLEHYQNILRTFDKYHSNLFFISSILLK